MSNIKHISYYTNVMQGWARELGGKPTEAHLSLAHVFGRPGKQSLAVAMALRDGGVTGNQIKGASALFDGKATPQLNHMRDLIAAGLFDRLPVSGAYAIKLTGKGQKFIDLHGAKAAERAPGKAEAVKPTKGKAVKAKAAKAKKAKPVEMAPAAAVVVPTEPAAPQVTA